VPEPKAAQVPKEPVEPKRGEPASKAKVVPLQVRWPASEVKAAKLAAIQDDFTTLSDFILACFHVYMKMRRKP
jgi:hypothetical protein